MDLLPNWILIIIQILEVGGPWAVVVFLGWGYVRKDRECREAYKSIQELAIEQTGALIHMETAIEALKDALNNLVIIMNSRTKSNN